MLLKYRDLIVRSFFCFLPGLLFFLYIPVTEYIAGRSDMSFFQLLSKFLGYTFKPSKLCRFIFFYLQHVLASSAHSAQYPLGSDPQRQFRLNTAITRLGVRAMNLFFFLYTMAIAFDLPLCPRYLSRA